MSGVARDSQGGPQAASCDATEAPSPPHQSPTCPVQTAWEKVLETQVPQPAKNGLKIKKYIGRGLGSSTRDPGYTSPLDASSWERLCSHPSAWARLPEPCLSQQTHGWDKEEVMRQVLFVGFKLSPNIIKGDWSFLFQSNPSSNFLHLYNEH